MQVGKHHTAALLVSILGLVLLSLLIAPKFEIAGATQQPQASSSACGADEDAVAGQSTLAVETGPQPGATDPMGMPAGRYDLLPLQGVGVFMPNGGTIPAPVDTLKTVFYNTLAPPGLRLSNSTTVATGPWNNNGAYGSTPVFVTAGRILSPDHDDVVYAVRNGDPGKPDSTVTINFVGQGYSTTLPNLLLPREPDSTDFIAIANGNLDNVVGADGNYHNEVVVVHVSEQSIFDTRYFNYRIDVLNYGAGNLRFPDITSTVFTETAPIVNTSPQSGVTGLLPSDNIVAVTIGDFQGDGTNEIAVAGLGDRTLFLYTYKYQTTNGVHTLTQVGAQGCTSAGCPTAFRPEQIGPAGKVVGTIDMTAGDFNGSGKDELAVAYAKWGPNANNNPKYGDYAIEPLILQYDSKFVAAVKGDQNGFYIGGIPDNSYTYFSRPRVEIVSGQFMFNPPSIPYGQHQIVLAWNESGTPPGSPLIGTQLKTQGYFIGNNLTSWTPFASPQYVQSRGSVNGGTLPITQQFSLAAGGFAGLPTAALALSYWAGTTGTGEFTVQTVGLNSTGAMTLVAAASVYTTGAVAGARLPLFAYDRNGTSAYLGAPVHLQVLGAQETDVMLQEPPKHLYWDETAKKVVNLTRVDANNVHLYNSTTSSVETSSTDETSRNTGGSVALTAGATVKGGGDFLIAKVETSTSVDVTLAGSYDYNEHKTQYNSGYGSRQFNSTSSTDHDDYLSGETQIFDVWRYRIYGFPSQGSTNTFYEIVMPGPKVPIDGGGLNFYWYQPVHENGNILSYPAALGPAPNIYIPSDLGTYKLPDGSTPKPNEPQVSGPLSYFGGTGGSTSLTYSTAVMKGKSFTYSHELAESADIKTAYTASAMFGGTGGEVRVCGEVEFHNSNSWGGSSTSTDTAQTQTAITLNKVSSAPQDAYPIYPVVYTTQDGTLKMAFAVPNPASSGTNPVGFAKFAELYGGLPDPALNLPLRFYSTTAGATDWVPNLNSSRKQMRGLFFRNSQVNPVTGTYDFLASNPAAGNTIRIEPRIYNYSTGKGTSPISIAFQTIPYDSSTNSEICSTPINAAAGKTTGLICPASARSTIGTATVPKLNPLQFTCLSGTDNPAVTGCAPSVYINWNTTGFGPSGFGTNEYRVYVDLNPGAPPGSEIYIGEPPPVAITDVASGSSVVVTAPGNHFSDGDYVVIAGVQGLNQVNGIFQVGSVSGSRFDLTPCQPSPPCAARLPGAGSGSGGTATLLDPGQNNEGYGYIAITAPPGLTGSEGSTIPEDYLASDSLEALPEGGPEVGNLVGANIDARLFMPVQLRFTAYSSAIHSDAAQVLLFDGDPAQGAAAVADTVIHPGENGSNGASVWFDWTPTTLGVHTLNAVLLEGSGAQQVAQLTVDVVR
jgi:hypothetical protein